MWLLSGNCEQVCTNGPIQQPQRFNDQNTSTQLWRENSTIVAGVQRFVLHFFLLKLAETLNLKTPCVSIHDSGEERACMARLDRHSQGTEKFNLSGVQTATNVTSVLRSLGGIIVSL